MTPLQRRALDFIEQFYAEKRFSPSLDEIAAALGKSAKSGAHRVVHALIQSGHLVRTAGGHRNIMPARVILAERTLGQLPTFALREELKRREADRG